ncbi:MAG: hypothetical protein H7Y18_18680 [Clostridiaceae bacterium]|nr:hypothetical protein [Clostridiaceae bacterium]
MQNTNINEEFSQELSDLKWQFENMQQIFSNLENTISQAKKSSDFEDHPEEDKDKDKDKDKDMFSNQSQKEDKGKEDKPKEDKPKEGDSKEHDSKQEKQSNQNSMQMNNKGESSGGVTKLSSQIQDFIKETQTQQTSVQQELQKSIQQAMDILNQANVQIQTNQALITMNKFINQAEQQINQIHQTNRLGGNQKSIQNMENQTMQSMQSQGQGQGQGQNQGQSQDQDQNRGQLQ